MSISCECENEPVEFWPDPDDPHLFHLDVRALLGEGGEPYQIIMRCVRQVEGDDVLGIHALFEPKPLMRQLGRMGFQYESEHVGPDHWILRIGGRRGSP